MSRKTLPCNYGKLLLLCLIAFGPFSFSFGQSYTIFQTSDAPSSPLANDGTSIELGVKFRSTQNGYITGIRFFKGAGSGGTRTGHLWSITGTLLAEAIFSNETVSGWQEVLFTTPVAITANTTYVASCLSSQGYYNYTNPFFTQPVVNGPLRGLASGEDGPNGVYKYTNTAAFPTDNFQTLNYWVDVVFTASMGPDTTPPSILAVSPGGDAVDVNVNTVITATFTEAIDPATVNSSTFQLKDVSNNIIPATLNVSGGQATLVPLAPLNNSSNYRAYIKGGAAGITDIAGNPASNFDWAFITADTLSSPLDGPGGPILIVSSTSNPFSRYTVEILRAEGMNEFAAKDISEINSSILKEYDVVVLGEMILNDAQASWFVDWVNAGGVLITFKPSGQLYPILGITKTSGSLGNKYIKINNAGPGMGIVNETIQYHGESDQFSLNGAQSLAKLYSDATTATNFHAITSRAVGTNGGKAIAFSFDLARSIVYTRQGNPAWAGQERDGLSPVRSDDLFFGNMGGDAQPDWIDFNKISIPQADEQQRMLVNIILQSNLHHKPLPRFWYLPKGLKAAIVMTGDDHANNGTTPRFNNYLSKGPNSPQDVADWNAVRSTSYIFPHTPITNEQARTFEMQGFEIALHPNTDCNNFSLTSLRDTLTNQLALFKARFPGLASPVSNRNHCLVWSDWASGAKAQKFKGIRLDVNYYNWPESWMRNIPGLFTGSGMPMRFADLDGTLIDCYQVPTQMTDETNMNYTNFCNSLLDKAIGVEGYYGVFCANMHTDEASSTGSDQIIASAQARGVPVVSAKQMLTWLDGRNNSFFGDIEWNKEQLSFTITAKADARNLKAMLPVNAENGTLIAITRKDNEISFVKQTIKGIEYAFFDVVPGTYPYTATYAVSSSLPTIITQPASQGACEGKTVTFSSKASGTPAPSVQWQESIDGVSWSIIDGATGSDLTVTTTLADNKKSYRAIWTNNHGTATTTPAILTVNELPELAGTLTAAVTSGVTFNYVPQSTTTGTTFSWTRAAVTGISNPAGSGNGTINETLTSTTSAPVNAIYLYRLTANNCINTEQLVLTVNPKTEDCLLTVSATANFNASSIPANRYIWFNSVIDPTGIESNKSVNLTITNATIRFTVNGQQYTLPVPNARIHFVPGITASTKFLNNVWETDASSSAVGNIFAGGLAYKVPASLPGNIKNVTWSATITSDKPGISLAWRWAAATYTNFGAHSAINVKPVDADLDLILLSLGDKAGTPMNYKSYLVSGATGGGALSIGLINVGLLNYTGNYSNPVTVSCAAQLRASGSASSTSATLSLDDEATSPTLTFGAKATPNPSTGSFTLFISSDKADPVILRIIDATGRITERHEKLRPNNTLRLGEQWKSGTYLAEVYQGGERKIIKLVKL